MTTCTQKKHPCPDCRECQQCGDTRCNLCRSHKQKQPDRFSGMSLAEQIAYFDAVNRGVKPEGDY